MSDAPRKVPEGKAPPAASPASPQRTVSNPGSMRGVMSAARADHVEPEKPQGPLGQRLAAGAKEGALNLVGVVREAIEDFRERDRFFKFKAAIVASWVVLSVTSIGVACPDPGITSGALGARVVVGTTPGRPTLMIYNESDEAWEDVIFIVNREYRAAVARVEPNGGTFTLTPKVLLNNQSRPAPSDMPMRELEMRTREGTAVLLENGQEKK